MDHVGREAPGRAGVQDLDHAPDVVYPPPVSTASSSGSARPTAAPPHPRTPQRQPLDVVPADDEPPTLVVDR